MPARRTPLDLVQTSMLLTVCALTCAYVVLIAFVADRPPEGVVPVETFASGRFDLTLIAANAPLRHGSPGLGAVLCGGFLLALPPLLVLAWLWARLLPYVVHEVPGSVLTGLGILLEALLLGPLAPAFPEAVSQGLGYPGALRRGLPHGNASPGETGTSPRFLVGLGPLYAFFFGLWICTAPTLQARMTGAAVGAFYAASYATAFLAARWKQNEWLAAPAPPVVNFSLRSMLLAFVSAGAYASTIALLFRG